MISELARQIDMLHREKNIPRDAVIEVLESAMVAAARKRFGNERDIEAQFNEELGEVELFEFKTVVEEFDNNDTEILIEEARALDPDCARSATPWASRWTSRARPHRRPDREAGHHPEACATPSAR
jgi:hypothetical protein